MDRAECGSPASADGHLDALSSPGSKPGARVRDQLRGYLPTSAPLTRTCKEGSQACTPYPSLPLCCHSRSPLGCLPEEGGEREQRIRRKGGWGQAGKTREGCIQACGLAAGKGVRLPLTPTACAGYQMPSCASLWKYLRHFSTHTSCSPLGGAQLSQTHTKIKLRCRIYPLL